MPAGCSHKKVNRPVNRLVGYFNASYQGVVYYEKIDSIFDGDFAYIIYGGGRRC